jgi:hypothetical protein
MTTTVTVQAYPGTQDGKDLEVEVVVMEGDKIAHRRLMQRGEKSDFIVYPPRTVTISEVLKQDEVLKSA